MVVCYTAFTLWLACVVGIGKMNHDCCIMVFDRPSIKFSVCFAYLDDSVEPSVSGSGEKGEISTCVSIRASLPVFVLGIDVTALFLTSFQHLDTPLIHYCLHNNVVMSSSHTCIYTHISYVFVHNMYVLYVLHRACFLRTCTYTLSAECNHLAFIFSCCS